MIIFNHENNSFLAASIKNTQACAANSSFAGTLSIDIHADLLRFIS